MKNENLHAGHRERLRKKFIENNFDSFEQHEILELLLFYSIPRINTNEIAHRLIARFKDLNGVFNADINELMEVDGIGESSVILLKTMPLIIQEYIAHINAADDEENRLNFNSICEYLIKQFAGDTEESFRVASLDRNIRITECRVIKNNPYTDIEPAIREIMNFACESKSDRLITAQNHISGNYIPSIKDVNTAQTLCKRLRPVGIIILDHIIVSGNKTFSMKEHNLLP